MDMKNLNLIHIILIFIIIIFIAYLFGLLLINIVDNRLSKIKLNIPKQEVIIKYPEEGVEHFLSKKVDSEEKTNDKLDDLYDLIKNKLSNKDKNEKKEKEKEKEKEITHIIQYQTYNKNGKLINKSNFDEDYYKMASENSGIEGFDNDYSNKNDEWKLTQKNNYKLCYKNHQHVKDGKNTECSYGITNYLDPYDMSPIDLKLFTMNYSKNMTMQDYINWLWCFKNMEDKLPYNHLKNLIKLKNGKELIQEDGVCPPPSYSYPSLDAETYFNEMYNSSNEFNIASPLNSTTGPMLGYNYNQYTEFSQNKDLYGLSGKIRNNDIYLKQNAKKLNDKIFMKDSNFIKMDDEYENYHIKDVEI
jgi:hypothetical protein